MKKILYIILIFLFISCTTTKYVEVPVKTVEIEYRDRVKHDSVYIKDSVIVKDRIDTVYVEKYKYIYRDRYLKDTVHITDTIPIVLTIETVKEVNRIKDWLIILMVLGGGAIILTSYKLIKLTKIK